MPTKYNSSDNGIDILLTDDVINPTSFLVVEVKYSDALDFGCTLGQGNNAQQMSPAWLDGVIVVLLLSQFLRKQAQRI